MKCLLPILLSILVLCTSLTAVEYGYLSYDGKSSVTLNTGDVLEILAAGNYSSNSGKVLRLTKPTGEWVDFTSVYFGFYNADSVRPVASNKKFVGPCEISTEWRYVAYKITRASEVEYKQANIISLPADTVGAGNHEIVVEASDDLQTWTPVHSSSIGGNKAFFRTRVVRVTE